MKPLLFWKLPTLGTTFATLTIRYDFASTAQPTTQNAKRQLVRPFYRKKHDEPKKMWWVSHWIHSPTAHPKAPEKFLNHFERHLFFAFWAFFRTAAVKAPAAYSLFRLVLFSFVQLFCVRVTAPLFVVLSDPPFLSCIMFYVYAFFVRAFPVYIVLFFFHRYVVRWCSLDPSNSL